MITNWDDLKDYEKAAVAVDALSETDARDALQALMLLIGEWGCLWRATPEDEFKAKTAKQVMTEIVETMEEHGLMHEDLGSPVEITMPEDYYEGGV